MLLDQIILICNNSDMIAKRKKKLTMTDALRQAIADCELSFQALERESGVSRQSLMKFVRGEQSLRLDMADRLASYFGVEIVLRKGK